MGQEQETDTRNDAVNEKRPEPSERQNVEPKEWREAFAAHEGRIRASAGAGLNPLEISGQLDATTDATTDATNPESEAVQRKKNELEKKFHIKFETAETSDYGNRVREPDLDELRALESALQKSSASTPQDTRSKSEMRVVFLSEQRGNEPTLQHQASPKGSRIAVFGKQNWPITIADLPAEQRNNKDANSLEREFLHELGHQSMSAMEVDPTKMGWRKAGNEWARETQDGRLWKFDNDAAQQQIYQWYEVDESGTKKENSTMSNVDMMHNSMVKPASDYFRTPQEDFAEGARIYRSNKELREQFQKDNPELSKYIADYDKREIAKKLGTDFYGAPLYERNDEGIIVEHKRNWSDWKHLLEKAYEENQRSPYPIVIPSIF